MADVTLFELHPDGDLQFGPKSIRGPTGRADETATAGADQTVSEPTDSSRGRSLGKLLLVVGFVALVVVMASKLFGEDADEEIAGFDEES